MNATWWPRGLGVQIDAGDRRTEVEPVDGARAWINLRLEQDRWESEANVYVLSPDPANDGEAFLTTLLAGIRSHVGGLDAAMVSRIPPDVQTLRKSFRDLSDRPPRSFMSVKNMPLPGALSAGEVLTPWKPLSDTTDIGRKVSAVSGEIAGCLGRAFKERFSWTRPLTLKQSAFDLLMKRLHRGDLEVDACWRLEVNRDGKSIDLLVGSPEAPFRVGAVLRLKRALYESATWNAGALDSKICDVLNAQFGTVRALPDAMSVSSGVDIKADDASVLARIDSSGRIFVLGHGSTGAQTVDLAKDYAMLQLGELSPEALGDALIRRGLRRDFAGTIHLFACNSASGATRTASYAQALLAALAARGYKKLGVTGLPGLGQALCGYTQTFPCEISFECKKTVTSERQALDRAQRRRSEARTGGDQAAMTSAGKDVAYHLRQLSSYRRWLGVHHETLNVETSLHRPEFNAAAVRDMWAYFGPGTGRAAKSGKSSK
ncbi:hypothetical protein CDL60_06575 [Roseateles noduli]|nr:hypothetical protein CDL60_06575 [Roseateles noduli]